MNSFTDVRPDHNQYLPVRGGDHCHIKTCSTIFLAITLVCFCSWLSHVICSIHCCILQFPKLAPTCITLCHKFKRKVASPTHITHAIFYVNQLRGFSAAAPRKVPFPKLFRTTLTTVLHYRADCDLQVMLQDSFWGNSIVNTLHWLKKESSNKNTRQPRLLKTGKAVIQHLSEMMLFLNYCIFSDNAEALVRCGGKL